jgi:hypothetical protein
VAGAGPVAVAVGVAGARPVAVAVMPVAVAGARPVAVAVMPVGVAPAEAVAAVWGCEAGAGRAPPGLPEVPVGPVRFWDESAFSSVAFITNRVAMTSPAIRAAAPATKSVPPGLRNLVLACTDAPLAARASHCAPRGGRSRAMSWPNRVVSV